jgi:hypothetical protein
MAFSDGTSRNPLGTKRDLEAALLALCRPVLACMSPGFARVRIGSAGASHSRTVQEMEGFCRLLWGVTPYAASAGDTPEVACLREGLANGTDPAHPEFWGRPADLDQRLVEFAAIAYAMLLAPGAFWHPLTARQRHNVASLLGTINTRQVRDNNWLYFRVLVNEALRRLDQPHAARRIGDDLARLDSFYIGDGWYADGPRGACDYYAAFGFHFYGLLLASLATPADAPYAARVRERATLFAAQFVHWFSPDGGAIPFGRSLSYRWAPAAFWGAAAFAGLDSMPMGTIKGMMLRHLRWWQQKPIVDESGLLTVGYGYEHGLIAERYTSPCSPYWALKAFLPLALANDHPFWTTAEAPPATDHERSVQRAPGTITVRHDRHVYALVAGRTVPQQHWHAPQKYAKFAYSTLFGFSVPSASGFRTPQACDSMLALTDDGEYVRVRTQSEWAECRAAGIVARWRPWDDVEVTTWLIPASVWHLRVHFVRTRRAIRAVEGGFGTPRNDDDADVLPDVDTTGICAVATGSCFSAIVDLVGGRTAALVEQDPNTNVLHVRCVLPTLESEHVAGDWWLACAVAGAERNACDLHRVLSDRPTVRLQGDSFTACDGAGRALFADTIGRVDRAQMGAPVRGFRADDIGPAATLAAPAVGPGRSQ